MAGGVDVEEVPRPEIMCRHYLSSIAKCAHVLNPPVLSTPGMMRRRFWTMDFFVRVQYTSMSSLAVAPCSENFGGEIIVIIPCHFPNEY